YAVGERFERQLPRPRIIVLLTSERSLEITEPAPRVVSHFGWHNPIEVKELFALRSGVLDHLGYQYRPGMQFSVLRVSSSVRVVSALLILKDERGGDDLTLILSHIDCGSTLRDERGGVCPQIVMVVPVHPCSVG